MRALHSQTSQLEKKFESIEKYEKELTQRIKKVEVQLEAKELDDKVKAMREAVKKTYLTLWFNSEGKTLTSVLIRLQDIGFKPATGKHNFVYDWQHEIGLEEICKLEETIHKNLRGFKVLYRLETF